MRRKKSENVPGRLWPSIHIAQHREWMIRAFGVALGIATTRPIVGVFFAAGRLSPHEFFGTAFWLFGIRSSIRYGSCRGISAKEPSVATIHSSGVQEARDGSDELRRGTAAV